MKQETPIFGGMTCVYMSEGNLHEGVVMEMFCDGGLWHVHMVLE